MRAFGLIGYPLGHSFSQSFFNQKFRKESILDAEYRNFEVKDLSEISAVLQEKGLVGLNVTIPHKQTVLNVADVLSEDVKAIGAANTLKLVDGKIHAFNTDYLGFMESLRDLPFDPKKKSLILGSGGSSMAIRYALEKLQIAFDIVSRNPTEEQLGYNDLEEKGLEKYSLIINTTPLGMHPNEKASPDIPYEQLNSNHFCYDLVYNPEMTQFLQKGSDQRAGVKNGLEMLVLQAEASWTIWSEVK